MSEATLRRTTAHDLHYWMQDDWRDGLRVLVQTDLGDGIPAAWEELSDTEGPYLIPNGWDEYEYWLHLTEGVLTLPENAQVGWVVIDMEERDVA